MCLFLFKYTSGKHDWTVFYLFCTCDACLSSPSSAVVVLVHFWCTVISLYKLLFSTVYSLPLHITASNEHDMIWTVLERLIVNTSNSMPETFKWFTSSHLLDIDSAQCALLELADAAKCSSYSLQGIAVSLLWQNPVINHGSSYG